MKRALALLIACGGEPPPPPPPPVSPCSASEAEHAGEATHYPADGTGQCSLPRPSSPLLVAAASDADYAKAARCGSCVVVTGPDDSEVIVQIVDRCPACKPGDLDLSRDAFALLAPLAKGRIPIRWLPVPCEVIGPLAYHFKEGSNPQWTAIQVRNHRYPIAALHARDARGTFVALDRADYNFFVGKALGNGPYTLRVTDARGQTHVESGVRGPDHVGSAQLPACP